MKKYKTGRETKENIMEAARELFYEKGYKNTTYNDICEKPMSIPEPSITIFRQNAKLPASSIIILCSILRRKLVNSSPQNMKMTSSSVQLWKLQII